MKLLRYILVMAPVWFSSCNYLDVVPDNIATLDYAFRNRHEAEKYLFTCYSYMPKQGDIGSNPALVGGDELWLQYHTFDQGLMDELGPFVPFARGMQSVVDPIGNLWSNGDHSMFKAIRDCNIFLANVGKVPDLQYYEKKQWIGEVEFLKAYYHWLLLRRYGPIPIKDKNMSVSVYPKAAQVERLPVDSCFNYIANLIDTAAGYLPDVLQDPVNELGRITRPIALSIKARILVTAASPLFNGNGDYANFKGKNGTQLFDPTYDPQKWVKAAAACKAAIDLDRSVGIKLYHFNPEITQYHLHPEMQVRMDLRNIMTDKWNSEIIWSNPNSLTNKLQELAEVMYNPQTKSANGWYHSFLSPPLSIAEMFYTKNGLPINEDKTLNFDDITTLRTASPSERFRIEPGYQTARINFDREPRYYADLGFDGGILYGAGNFVDTMAWHYESKYGQYSSGAGLSDNLTGYYCKKVVSFQNTMSSASAHSTLSYPWPIMRLADLYLLYAEALNEVDGPGPEVYKWVDLVRARAGIPSVEESWTKYSKEPGKYKTKDGMREIIHRERMIEMVFEGSRFWDLRRWKEAGEVLNEPIQGWDRSQSNPDLYYRIITLFDKKFNKRDYFWPIKEHDLLLNKNLVQNPGW
jgi:hypothetical protein